MKANSSKRPVLSKAVFGGCLLVCLALATAQADDVVVLKGASAKVPVAQGVRKIIVANPAVINAQPADDGQAVLVSGLSEGNSELRVECLQGPDLVENVVVRSDLKQMADEISQLLSDVDGLEIKTIGNKIVLKGNILTKSDYEKVNKVVEAYPSVILNMSKFDRSAMNKYVEAAILQDIGMDTITARVMEDTVILEGIVFSDADRVRAEEIAKLRMPNVRNLLRVQDVMIETDVQFVSVDSDVSSDIGHNALDSVNGTGGFGGGGTGVPTLTYGVSAATTVNAHLGSANGKTLAQPHLSTKSGEEGSFQSGGSSYFQVSGVSGGTLQEVDYGIIVKVKPTLQGRDRIVNEVTVEVSLPNPKGQGTFSLDKFQTKSTAICKVGESIVLSGLVQQMASHFKDKAPLLGDIPLLSLFFSEKQSDNSKKELLVVITPRPVFPQAATGESFSEQQKALLDGTTGDKDRKN
jgi:pilus assembly protein CpaC